MNDNEHIAQLKTTITTAKMNANFEKQVERILSKAKSLNIRLGETIDLESIRKIEKKEKVTFPESYVVFLTEIENGGIGPYDEIYSLEK